MSVYLPIISYKGKTNYDFQLVTSHFADNADSGEFDSYQTMEPIYTENYDGTLRHDFGARHISVAQPVVTFVDPDGDILSPYKIRSVLRWLTGSKDVSFMDICNETGESVAAYIGRFTDVKLYKMDARVIGIIATFTSISPFAYSPIKEARFTVTTEGTDFILDCDSDDQYNVVHPTVEFTNTQAKDSENPDKIMLSLYNETTQHETTFKNLNTGEVVTINSSLCVYSDNTARIFNDDFNYTFPCLASGSNNFTAVGEGELVIRFRYPMKLADGLLDAQQIDNSPVVYIEETTMFIKGDLSQNPPNGTSIIVNGTTLTIRGNLKSVKIPGFSEVEDGNLIIDYGNVSCAMDSLYAEVENGELFIGAPLDQVTPHYNYEGRN